jgi:hypothetical protein
LQAWQFRPEHEFSQHTPFTHWPDVQSLALVQASPSARSPGHFPVARHAPRAPHEAPGTQVVAHRSPSQA